MAEAISLAASFAFRFCFSSTADGTQKKQDLYWLHVPLQTQQKEKS